MDKYAKILQIMDEGKQSDVAIYNQCTSPASDSPELAFATLHAIEIYRRHPTFRRYVWRHIRNGKEPEKRQETRKQ